MAKLNVTDLENSLNRTAPANDAPAADTAPVETVTTAADLAAGDVVSGDRGAPTGDAENAPTGDAPAATAAPDTAAPVEPVKPVKAGLSNKQFNKAMAAYNAAVKKYEVDMAAYLTAGAPATAAEIVANEPAAAPDTKPGNIEPADYSNVAGYNGNAWLDMHANAARYFNFVVPPFNLIILNGRDSSGRVMTGDYDAWLAAGQPAQFECWYQPGNAYDVIDTVTWHHCVVAQRAFSMQSDGATIVNAAQAIALRPDCSLLDKGQWALVRTHLLNESGKRGGTNDPKHNEVFGPGAKNVRAQLVKVFAGSSLNSHVSKRLGITAKAMPAVRAALRGVQLNVPAYFEAHGVFEAMPGFTADKK